MRRLLSFLIAFILVAGLFGCATADESPAEPEVPQELEQGEESAQDLEGMTPGTYIATCKGFYGDFDVKVEVNREEIVDITVGSYSETEDIGGAAIWMMVEQIMENNSVGVDIVSGATLTSRALRVGVEYCLQQAGAPESMFAAPEVIQTNQTISSDVLVIGAGAAGFSAAIMAAEKGADVVLIEKQDIVGGSTITSAGIVYAALDENDVNSMARYYELRAENNASQEMLRYFAENSLDTISFLEGLGVQWMFAAPAGTAPEARARFSMKEDGTGMIGSALILPMEAKASKLGVTILTGVTATELTQDADGKITGALAESKYGDYTFEAGAVVLATGGFDASEEMKRQYSPIAVGDFPLSSKGNTGDGINMGIAVGADTVFKGGIIGFAFVDGILPNSGMNGLAMNANSYVEPDGTFVMNLVDYPVTYTAIKNSEYEHFYGLYDGAGSDNGEAAIALGYGYKGETVEELAAASGMDPEKLENAFSRTDGIEDGPYYAVMVKPTTIGSMGGLKVNTASEVLGEDGEAIPGLYAAGEVANGDFYYQEYPASGSSISISITFGRAAGVSAAEFVLGAGEEEEENPEAEAEMENPQPMS